MSRRSFPRIDTEALRDHADEARVDRVWDRIEHDLASRAGSREGARGRRSTVAYLAIAATFGAFGAGLWVGKATWDHEPRTPAAIATPVIDKSLVEVLAAGSQSRTHTLQGGGTLTLLPGATAEVERSSTGAALTISLLQGEASIDATDRKGLSVVAGDARINTQAGAVLSVRRNAEDIDVNVSGGTVSLSSPAGTQQLGKGERAAGVPIHARVASAPVDAAPRRGASPARRPAGSPRAAAKRAGQPEWLARYHTDEEAALVLLRKQGVNEAIDKARSATELMAIADIMRHKGRDPAAAARAFRRVVDSFAGDQNAYSAANYLAEFYQSQGEMALAQQYRERAKLQAMAADALYCNLIAEEPEKTRAADLGSRYLAKYPNGQCHERIREMLQAEEPAPAPDPPAAPSNSTAPPAPPPH